MDRQQVEALVEQITREVVAILRTEENGTVCAMDASGVCVSCELCVEKCPDRVQEIVAAGATRVSSVAGVKNVVAALAKTIDHTLLKADASEEQLKTLCDEARSHEFATVCVNPANVRFCADLLRGSSVGVCSVVGFPLGATTPQAKAFEVEGAIRDGASEIDMVINIGALKSRKYELVFQDIKAVSDASHRLGAHCKVIIEAAMLTDEEKVIACKLAKEARADFVKTSTGFGPGGATLADVALMRRTVGEELGVKAAGGIRDFRTAAEMIAAGATRIGASAGVKILQEAQAGES